MTIVGTISELSQKSLPTSGTAAATARPARIATRRGLSGVDRSARGEATVVIGSNSRDLLFAEQPGRSDQQEGDRQDVGEPVGHAAVDKRADVDVGKVFRSAD